MNKLFLSITLLFALALTLPSYGNNKGNVSNNGREITGKTKTALEYFGRDYKFTNKIPGLPEKLSDVKGLEITDPCFAASEVGFPEENINL